MNSTAAALSSSEERVAMTWAASRCGSHSSKWSFSDLSYSYDSNEGVDKAEYSVCLVAGKSKDRTLTWGRIPSLGREQASFPIWLKEL